VKLGGYRLSFLIFLARKLGGYNTAKSGLIIPFFQNSFLYFLYKIVTVSIKDLINGIIYFVLWVTCYFVA